MPKEKSKVLGKCPKCGKNILSGEFGAFCSNRCGINISKFRGKLLTDEQVVAILNKEQVLIEGLVAKTSGKTYSIYATPTGEIEPYTYDYNGYQGTKYRLKYDTKFPTINHNRNSIDAAIDSIANQLSSETEDLGMKSV